MFQIWHLPDLTAFALDLNSFSRAQCFAKAWAKLDKMKKV